MKDSPHGEKLKVYCMEKQFNAQYIDNELRAIGIRVKKPLNIYLIGGCSLSFRNLKESTKDVDIVFKSDNDCRLFCDALFGAQYHEPFEIKFEYENLRATKMYENKDGLHLDLFVKQVMGKLNISEKMIKRAESFKKYGNLSVYLLSKEDVFLFKGLASERRERDLTDMRVLYPNLKWEAIEEELKSQKLSKELISLFIRRLERFEEVFELGVPLLKKLKKEYKT